MLIWGAPVSTTQFFGYSIALGGMMYYKLGADQIKGYAGQAGRSWQEFGNNKPVTRKVVVFGSVLFIMFILLGGLAPTYAPDQTTKLADFMGFNAGGVVGNSKST